jgi:predicted DNA binding CopG/RHH family protein
MLMEKAMNHKIKLDEYEEKVENEIFNFISLSKEEKDKIEKIIDQENEKKSIKLRLRKYDLEKLKERARNV